MIKFFVSDIDGCLAEPYRPYRWECFRELSAFVKDAAQVRGERRLPALSICSGRPYSYVEAVTQALGLRTPVLFESGGGLFDPVRAQVVWHPSFTDEMEGQLLEVRQWLKQEILPGTAMMLDYGKRTQAGIIGPNPDEVAARVPVVEGYVAASFPEFRVFHTSVSIDVLPATLTKKEGLTFLAEYLGCTLDEMAFIGDTNGDLGALKAVGYSFAPANATEEVKRAVQVVTDGALIDGVLEAFRWCVRHNEAVLRKAS